MNTRIFAASLLSTCLGLVALPASASFVLGDLTVSGDFAPFGGVSLADATGIDFIGDDLVVDAASDDFASMGIAPGDTGIMFDFEFGAGAPGFDLWALGGFTFHSNAPRLVFQNTNFLIVQGTGTVTGNGYLETSGSWSLTANRAGSLFNFSSGTTVPEPATILLLGIGFAGFGVRAMRRAR